MQHAYNKCFSLLTNQKIEKEQERDIKKEKAGKQQREKRKRKADATSNVTKREMVVCEVAKRKKADSRKREKV